MSEKPYIERPSHMRISGLICNVNQLMGFCGVRIFSVGSVSQ